MNLDSQNIVDHLLELQSNIHAFTAMEQYCTSSFTQIHLRKPKSSMISRRSISPTSRLSLRRLISSP